MGEVARWEVMERGVPVMWPLLAVSLLAVALILDRSAVFLWSYQTLRGVTKGLRPLIVAGAWDKAARWCARPGPLTLVARVYLENRDQPREVREARRKRESRD